MTVEDDSYLRLHEQVSEFFGARAGLSYVNSRENSTTAVLYESIIFTCSLAQGRFTATLRGGLDELFPGVPDEIHIEDATPERVAAAFGQIDAWSRARLPQKYLTRFDEVVASGRRREVSLVDGGKLSFDEVADLAVEFWGRQLDVVSRNPEDSRLDGSLYGVFAFGTGLERYEIFGAGIAINGEIAVRHYLGFEISLNNDRNSVLTAFEMIDEYCRARLPDDYLKMRKRHGLFGRRRF